MNKRNTIVDRINSKMAQKEQPELETNDADELPIQQPSSRFNEVTEKVAEPVVSSNAMPNPFVKKDGVKKRIQGEFPLCYSNYCTRVAFNRTEASETGTKHHAKDVVSESLELHYLIVSSLEASGLNSDISSVESEGREIVRKAIALYSNLDRST